jgi:peptidyl-Lys metalloendopeptidase
MLKPDYRDEEAKMNRKKVINSLLISLDFDKRSYKAVEKLKFVFALTNESKTPIQVLKWHTPLEGIKSDMFQVTSMGKRCIYLGRVYKRGAPREEDYITIPSGKTVKEEIDFTEYYDVFKAADYSVKYKIGLVQAGVEESTVLVKKYMKPQRTQAVLVRANIALFKLEDKRQPKTIDGIRVDELMMRTPDTVKKTPAFSSCSLSQQSTIAKALAQAVNIAEDARTALADAPGWARYTAPRYKEWFGIFSNSRYNNVNTHFDKICDALVNKIITFDCSSTENYYAYVYPTRPYTIYLCKLFWTATLSGTDSQGGTILHEMSHFNIVAGTDDQVYGQTGCRNIADSHPDCIVENADSHEYFSENILALSMNAVPGSIFKITDHWRRMPAGFSGSFDAILNGAGLSGGKCYFFKGDKYIRYDWEKNRADNGYPKKISPNWHTLPAGFTSHFDAAINGQGPFAGKCYFFKGDRYIRYDWAADKVDSGYPKKIADNWHNLPDGFKGNFEAIINGRGPFTGKVYFFKGDRYIRYDWQADRTDDGYPKRIADHWHCLPAGYTGSFNDALEGDRRFSDEGYFFKGNDYFRYNWEEDRAEA